MHKARLKALADPVRRQYILAAIGEGQRRAWRDPKTHSRRLKAIRKSMKRPEVRKAIGEGVRRSFASGTRKIRHDSPNFLCEPCRGRNCLACDGGNCRCVCILELDVKRTHVRNETPSQAGH